MRRIGVLFSLLLFAQVTMQAQYNETIRAARPRQSMGFFTIGARVLQVQTGLDYRRTITPNTELDCFSETTVLRLGLAERFDLSGVIRYTDEERRGDVDIQRRAGISNTQIGARYHISNNNGLIPDAAIQARVLLRAQDDEFQREHVGLRVITSAQYHLLSWVSLRTNLGMTWRGDGADPDPLYAAGFGFSLASRLTALAELYGDLGDEPNFATGFSYLLTNDVQLDLGGGWEVINGNDDWYLRGGISFRFDWR